MASGNNVILLIKLCQFLTNIHKNPMGNPDKQKTKLGGIWVGSVQGKSRKSEKTLRPMTRFPQL